VAVASSTTAGRGGEALVGRHRSVWVFLGRPHLGAETPVYEGWISLDFLGFPWILSSESRLINGLRGIFRGSFFLGPVLAREEPERAPAVEAIRKGGIVHGASLLQFLIVSNQLSSDAVEHAKLASHRDARGQHRHLHERPHG
jgi:hypothetical protein